MRYFLPVGALLVAILFSMSVPYQGDRDHLSAEVLRQRQRALDSLYATGVILRVRDDKCEVGPRFHTLESTRQYSVLLTVFVFLFDTAEGRSPDTILRVWDSGVWVGTFDPEQGLILRNL